MEGELKRVRLSFESVNILKKSHRKEGLNLSWLLIKPSHHTVYHIANYIISVFELHRSCPNGIILTMDGFVLPSFESASILKDKDVIGVKRKGKLLSEITNVDDGDNLINDDEIVEKKAFLTSVPLLANEEFEKESVGYLSETDEEEEEEQQEKGNQLRDGSYEEKSPGRNKVSKKRKASKKPGIPNKKKKKKSLLDPQHSDQMQAIMTHLNVDENVSSIFHPGQSSGTKKDESKVKKKRKGESTLVSVESNDDTSQPLPSPKRSSPIQENDMGCGASSQVPDGTEKRPSRSARRKKAKRQWLREIVKAEKELLLPPNGTCSQLGTGDVHLKRTQPPEIGINKQSVEHQQQNQNCEADNEVALDPAPVPIVIRPGHIRFEPLEEDEERPQQRHVSAEMIQWNGITNKKKGQKWGKEKSTFWRNKSQDFNKECSETLAIEDVKPPDNPAEFDNFTPLARLPKEGDLIAYRLVELSSTRTPELTSFRVGKTSWYDSLSNKILLTPLPEYPIVIEKLDEEDTFAQPLNNSLYKEDGSLEVDFSSLVDVRMVKESDSDPAKVTSDGAHVALMSSGATNSSTTTPSENGIQVSTLHSEKQENAWDEISEALNAKKAELMLENGWIKENSGKGGSSYRSKRGSAMGPLMARLRANNEI